MELQMMLVGIDPGLNNLGLAAVSGDEFCDVMVQKLTFKPIPGLVGVVSDYTRCHSLTDDLYQWILSVAPIRGRVVVEGVPLNSLVIVVEGPSLARRGAMSIQTGQLHYAIYSAISRQRGAYVIVVEPTVLKKYVTGRGNSGKEQVLEGILKKFFDGVVPGFGSQDLYEAYALARFGGDLVEGTLPKGTNRKKVQVYEVRKGAFQCTNLV